MNSGCEALDEKNPKFILILSLIAFDEKSSEKSSRLATLSGESIGIE